MTEPRRLDRRRQRRLRASSPRPRARATAATGCGRGTSRSRPPRRTSRPPRPSSPGRRPRNTRTRRREGGLGRRAAGHPHLALRERRTIRTRRPSPTMTSRRDRRGRHHASRRSKPVPYTGGQFVAIPEFQGIGTSVGQQFSAGARRASRRRRRARAGPVARDARDDPGRLHQVARSPTRPPDTAGRPHLRPPSLGCGRIRAGKERSHGHTPDREDCPLDALPGDHPAAGLDDRAAGDDALLLVPELQPAESRPPRVGPDGSTTSISTPIRRSFEAIWNTLVLVARRAAHHRGRRHRHRHADRPADLRAGASCASW